MIRAEQDESVWVCMYNSVYFSFLSRTGQMLSHTNCRQCLRWRFNCSCNTVPPGRSQGRTISQTTNRHELLTRTEYEKISWVFSPRVSLPSFIALCIPLEKAVRNLLLNLDQFLHPGSTTQRSSNSIESRKKKLPHSELIFQFSRLYLLNHSKRRVRRGSRVRLAKPHLLLPATDSCRSRGRTISQTTNQISLFFNKKNFFLTFIWVFWLWFKKNFKLRNSFADSLTQFPTYLIQMNKIVFIDSHISRKLKAICMYKNISDEILKSSPLNQLCN